MATWTSAIDSAVTADKGKGRGRGGREADKAKEREQRQKLTVIYKRGRESIRINHSQCYSKIQFTHARFGLYPRENVNLHYFNQSILISTCKCVVYKTEEYENHEMIRTVIIVRG